MALTEMLLLVFVQLQADGQLVYWILADAFCDLIFLLDIAVQFRTGYLEQGLMVYKTKKLAKHYMNSRPFCLDLVSLTPTDLAQFYFGIHPMFRFDPELITPLALRRNAS